MEYKGPCEIDCPLKCEVPEGSILIPMPRPRHDWADMVHCPNYEETGCERSFMVKEVEIEQELIDRVNKAAAELNAIPWWHPFKRQDAAREYKNALLAAAFAEIDAKEGKT